MLFNIKSFPDIKKTNPKKQTPRITQRTWKANHQQISIWPSDFVSHPPYQNLERTKIYTFCNVKYRKSGWETHVTNSHLTTSRCFCHKFSYGGFRTSGILFWEFVLQCWQRVDIIGLDWPTFWHGSCVWMRADDNLCGPASTVDSFNIGQNTKNRN